MSLEAKGRTLLTLTKDLLNPTFLVITWVSGGYLEKAKLGWSLRKFVEFSLMLFQNTI